MQVDFDKMDGLVPAVVQDVRTGDVLMLGYMNQDALSATRSTGLVTFFSRSRGRLWQKGESSGNVLHFVDARADCDGDALLIRARPEGPTCHTGASTCWGEPDAREGAGFLRTLSAVIDDRAQAEAGASYTRRLLDKGPAGPGQKVGEEAVETVIAALSESDDDLVNEASDLVYHLLVLLKSRGLTLDDIGERLRQRHAG
ncbi:MAG: bifunctional phosphoribosyl-AMP cyclohydrolase/phosphoribosyl-ATP diphosphatase HisIE [Rhodothermales bacterium]|nr:bifunctional phosphoribosyl-AMP cyclohydrolase/phosphoribosyl-ATP diphosphatase HisIE [Rhodothermales bacterium]MBO6778313.1 bifunctional phosphoribosyl-AMP cyclohydrolase/phosphoribosyl-ATP diphosphatase HisIE [Rhodothermales bacterium]